MCTGSIPCKLVGYLAGTQVKLALMVVHSGSGRREIRRTVKKKNFAVNISGYTSKKKKTHSSILAPDRKI